MENQELKRKSKSKADSLRRLGGYGGSSHHLRQIFEQKTGLNLSDLFMED